MNSAEGETEGRTTCGSVFQQEGEDEENPEEGIKGHGVGPSHVEAKLLAGGSQWKYPADHCEDALGAQCQGHVMAMVGGVKGTQDHRLWMPGMG